MDAGDARGTGPNRPDEQRAVITGYGAITPIGNSAAAYWEALYAARYGLPTALFHGVGRNLAMDEDRLAQLYRELDTDAAARRLMTDLHLHPGEPWLGQLFTRTLADWRGRIDALYILGDLFEYWVGDDDDEPFTRDMLAQMRHFAAQTPLYVLRGNRDFLLGAGFAAASGATLLDEPHTLTVGGRSYVLVHGDGRVMSTSQYDGDGLPTGQWAATQQKLQPVVRALVTGFES